MSGERTACPESFREAIKRKCCDGLDTSNQAPFAMDLHATHLWTGSAARMWHLFHDLRANGANSQSSAGPDKMYSSTELVDTHSDDEDDPAVTTHDILRSPENAHVVLCQAEKSAMIAAAADVETDEGVGVAWDKDLEAYFGSTLIASLPLYSCGTRPGDLLLDSRGTTTPTAHLDVYLAAYIAFTRVHDDVDMPNSRSLTARVDNGVKETWASVMEAVLRKEQGGWIDKGHLELTVPLTSTASGLVSHGFSDGLPGQCVVPEEATRGAYIQEISDVRHAAPNLAQLCSELDEAGDSVIGGLIGVVRLP